MIFEAELWKYPGDAAWFFLTLPGGLADQIRAEHGHRAAGFGSLKVLVTVGGSTWSTSVFPDRRRNSYLLPVKRAVRRAECLEPGDRVTVRLKLADLSESEHPTGC